MASSIEMLEQRIETLRTRVRQALMSGDRQLAATLRRQLRQAERDWDDALELLTQERTDEGTPPGTPHGHPDSTGPEASERDRPGTLRPVPPEGTRKALPHQPTGEWASAAGSEPPAGMALPLREQVHQALTLLTVPAAPRLISAVHEAFFAGVIFGARLTSMRRDEERSFRTAPFARPYYLCAALTADLLAPARGLLAVSTWPMERRVIGPLSPRVDFLTAAIQVAEGIRRIPHPSPEAFRLLLRFASNIPGGTTREQKVDAAVVAQAAAAERGIHAEADRATRQAAALRARGQLDDVQQLFGTRLAVTPRTSTAP
jgi:hypothetical protein